MSHYQVDEKDILFNMKECPGLGPIQELGVFEDCDEATFDMIFDQSKSFCQKVLAPLLMHSDRKGCGFEGGRVTLPEGVAEAWEQYRELDMIGLSSQTEFGGAALPHFFGISLTEMECGSFVAFSMLPLLTRGAARLIQSFGDQQQKEAWLRKMFSGQWTGTMCLTEPDAGSDVGAGTTSAEPHGDGYKITGTKIFISWGEHDLAENIIHLVLARITGAPAGSKGLSLFIVPKHRIDDNGNITVPNDVVCGNIEHKMGIKASPTCVINYGTDGDCIGHLLGEPNQGMRYMFQMMNEARIEVGVQGVAQASAAYLSALDYAGLRVQGSINDENGPRPAKIIEHPDVRRMLLKMRALVQGSRTLIYHLMQYVDLAQYHPSEAEKYQALVELLTPICKSYGSDQGFRVTEMAVQTLGGYGYCQEYPVEQYMRDCKISSIYEGTNGIQALDLLFRKILRNKGAYLEIWQKELMALCGECRGSELAGLADELLAAAKVLGATTVFFGEMMAANKLEEVQFYATEFQESMGHIMVAFFLLRQSRTALDALANAGRDASFYRQKIITTQYFIGEFLPAASSALKHMCRREVIGLAAVFN